MLGIKEATGWAPCLPILRGYKLYDPEKNFIITALQIPLIFNRHKDSIKHGITNDPRPHGDGGVLQAPRSVENIRCRDNDLP